MRVSLKKSFWRNAILEAIINEGTLDCGRAGETSATLFADRLEKLASAQDEAEIALQALASLVKNPLIPPGVDEDLYWRNTVFFSQYIHVENKGVLIDAFRSRLFQRKVSPLNIECHIFNGYITTGGTLKISELNHFHEVKRSAPIIWLRAAVNSGHFLLARNYTEMCLRENTLDVNILVIILDSWRSIWDKSDFPRVVSRFIDSASSETAKQKLRNWISARGLMRKAHSKS